MDNIKPITKPFGIDSLWPKQPYHRACAALMLNVPASRGQQTFHFCVKSALGSREHKDAVNMCLEIQSTGHVGFQALQLVKADERIAEYCATHRGQLRNIGQKLDDNTVMFVVGKLTKYEGRETFIVYYLIENKTVILDSISIKHKLGLDVVSPLADFMMALAPYTVIEVEVDGANSTVKCAEFETGNVRDSYVAFPISKMDSRGPNETPVMTTTPMHMRFMSFTYNGA